MKNAIGYGFVYLVMLLIGGGFVVANMAIDASKKAAEPAACKCDLCRCRKEVSFIGAVKIFGGVVAITNETECILDGKPTEWGDIPDENTELVEVSVSLKRRVATKVVYVSAAVQRAE